MNASAIYEKLGILLLQASYAVGKKPVLSPFGNKIRLLRISWGKKYEVLRAIQAKIIQNLELLFSCNLSQQKRHLFYLDEDPGFGHKSRSTKFLTFVTRI
jgi:hypothetical protein